MLRSAKRLLRLANVGYEPVSAINVKKIDNLKCYSTRPRDFVESSTANIVRSQFADVALSPLPYADFIFENIGQFGHKVALECAITGRSYTYEVVQLFARKFGSSLVRRGLRKGDVLGIICPNIPEFPIVFLGVTCVGGVASTVNPTYTSEEIARQLQNSNATFVVTVGPLADKVKEAISHCPLVKEAFVIGGDADGMTPISSLAVENDAALAGCPPIDVAEDLLVLPYSSGTTGLPKGVMLTHHNITTNILQATDPNITEQFTSDDTVLAILPFFHSYALTTVMSIGLRNGLKIVTLPQFEPESFMKALHVYKPNLLHLVPPLVHFLGCHPQLNVKDLCNLRLIACGAAPLSISIVKDLLQRIHPQTVSFQEGYGMTELSPVSHFCPKYSTRIGTCGVLIANSEAKIVDLNTGEALGPNCEGELYVRGPQVMKGYLNNEEATRETIDEDGWLHTGDIGSYDEEGFFHVFDRLKELIKVKGLQ
uniref:AMP-dependent synthetase/ligase domain-containing protein n=1 Tax=Strigamia maritima TaxID=126957 RepID=T1J951_STRMM